MPQNTDIPLNCQSTGGTATNTGDGNPDQQATLRKYWTLVGVVIGNDDGTAAGTFAVSNDVPDRILNGLVPVTFDRGADTFVRVGDRAVYLTTGRRQSVAVWWDDSYLFVLSSREDYETPRALLRAALEIEP